jgi:hypothetical protein
VTFHTLPLSLHMRRCWHCKDEINAGKHLDHLLCNNRRTVAAMKNSSVAIVNAGRRSATGTLDVAFRVGDASQHSQRSHKIDFAQVTQITVEAYFEARADSTDLASGAAWRLA